MFNFKFQRTSKAAFVIGDVFFCTAAVFTFFVIENFILRKGLSVGFYETTPVVLWLTLFFLGLPLGIFWYKQQRVQEELTYHDDVTGLYNRRYLLRELSRELDRARRYGLELSILMIDVDNFKNINDEYGHLAGDGILKGVSSILAKDMRLGDIVGRYGGDEFLAILPETEYENAQSVALRLWVDVVERSFRIHKETVHVSISVGSASLRDFKDYGDILNLIDRADQEMLDLKYSARKEMWTAKEP